MHSEQQESSQREQKPAYDQALKEIAQAPVSRQEKSRLMGLLDLLAGMRLPRADLVKALERDHMIEEIWKESSFAEAVTEISRKEMAREMAQIALEDRFGAISQDILEALNMADETTLKSLLKAKSLEDVQALLGLS